MARSRYVNNPTVQDVSSNEPQHFLTWNFPIDLAGFAPIDLLKDTDYIEYSWRLGDRLDRLASKYYSDDQYWWVIALVNSVSYPLSIKVGTVLRIPKDVNPVLQRLELI